MDYDKARLSEDERRGLADVVEVSRAHRERLSRIRHDVMRRHVPDLAPPEEDPAASDEGLATLEELVRSGDLESYLASSRETFSPVAASGYPFGAISRALVELIGSAEMILEEAFSDDPPRVYRAARALHRLETETLIVAGEAYASLREEQVESEYSDTVRRLSTPVIQVWDDVLVMPLIGVLDSHRAQQMMEQLLDRVVALQARIVIIDITGVPTVDTAVAEHLIRTTKASRLVGTSAILVGISPQVAQTLVRLGVVLDDIDTFTDLRSGLEHALTGLGYAVTRP